MKYEKILQPQEMIELEIWLKEKENTTLTLSEWINLFAKLTEEKREYIIMAKKLPQKEIEEAIEYYDGNRFPVVVDELAFINSLATKYSQDKRMIIERIKQVRMINNSKKTEIKVKKRKKTQK